MEEIVHIIPLGYEIDRAVKPFEGSSGLKANRVYLLSPVGVTEVPTPIAEKHGRYLKTVQERLESLGIKVIVVPTNIIDIFEVLKQVSCIIREEEEKKNMVYVNMSSSGRLTSVAATLAGMVHGVKVYYVESNDYADNDPRMEEHGYTIVEIPKIRYLENFQINLPDETQMKVLVRLQQRGKMRTLDIIEYLRSECFPDFAAYYPNLNRNEKSRLIMKLNRNILDKLERQGLIRRNKLGREKEFEITEAGKYIGSISGLFHADDSRTSLLS